jgi:septum formation protein
VQPILLASASPRRRELLARAGLAIEVLPADVDESQLPDEAAGPMAERLALAKAEAIAAEHPSRLVVAADTVVVRDGAVLGKPRDTSEAVAMLASLSGREHEVITGFAVLGIDGATSAAVSTRVRFRSLSAEVIEAYVATGEPMDKAGAYGIQGIGAKLVRSISGSYTNVVGLPLVEVLEAIALRGGPKL